MPPDFLNSREDAVLFWTLVIVGYGVYKDPGGVSGAFLGVVRAALHPKLLLLFGSALLYCALAVYAAKEAGLWHTATFKVTLYWFVGTAVVLVGEAVMHSSSDGALVARVLARVVAVTILVEFLVNLYTFPFVVEFILVFLVILFAGLEVVARHDASTDPLLLKFIESVLVTIGLIYLANFVIKALGDPDSLLTSQRAEELLVGPTLTVVLVPFVYGVAWLSRREQAHLRRRWQS